MKKLILCVMICLFGVGFSLAQTLTSPDGNLVMDFHLSADKTPVYSLKYKGKDVIKESKMGFQIRPSFDFSKNFRIVETKEDASDTTWNPVWGQNSVIRDNHKELFVALEQEGTGWLLNIRFRLFDDGLGFRYEFPVQKELRHFTINEEVTEFQLVGNHKAFWIPADYDTNEFQITTSKLSEVPQLIDKARDEALACKSPSPNLAVQTPLMLKSDDGLYINIHEAALVNYPAMHLNLDAQTFLMSSHLTPDKNGTKGYIQTGSTSPWRTIIVSDDARNILASNLIVNLNEPCKLEDTSWIKPTKYVGVWWEYFTGGGSTWAYTDTQDIVIGKTDYTKLKPNGHHGANTAHVKEYIDFAAKNGFDAVLVEGWNEGWEDNYAYAKEFIYSFTKAYPDFDVKELQRYAASKGVKIIMHHETTSSVADYERQMHDAFRFMKENGYDAVKTGYVGPIIPRSEHHDGQWMVNHYNRVAETAAQYHIMVNSHEAVRPTGMYRTYPNWIAQESARGTEFESFNGIRPDHQTILPFTRLMGGPMDYTPGIFEGDLSAYGSNKAKLGTTLVKQLALYVTMYSPLQMAADLYQNYEKYPDAFQFIKDVAVDWDNTYILEAEPGDYITIARKAKGKNEWYIGGITDENSREAVIDLSFLPAGKKYQATIYADGKTADWRTNPKEYVISTKKVTNKTKLKQRLAPSGGVAVSIKEL
ncbi:glycoside hydrolase family 97 protein [Phocaeicola coprocola]|uniref:glycoside hydrolase family 97 protein n=1 Tax=Phocaeicola coprocola TaxID=310298 RepID=UPI001C394755|nr:glycoside hydrolase family 97 protein [Phocaeicola coprocola]MBV3866688.1 glycoside hydrolase family 97 protein [Phocaeicola coprocola]MBV4007879.1 glycoside hydrolase family 97 protein [Phocaeicola coprocola]MBV4032365.1 glycoside hydrolase family 97 protein [Phocaeicola coprocola]MBV4038918.1 glycoside hydrolase family 97 protein [Phocaeicola coprocola]MBV4060528.1 glycoside hydrolase family 97 protein [Phocaeicola coprocola]